MTDKKSLNIERCEVVGTVATLALLSIGIPIVTTLGNGPTFFVAHNAPLWLVALIIGALLLIPIVLLLVPVVMSSFIQNGKLRLTIVTAPIGALFALLTAQHLPDTNLPAIVFYIIAGLSGISGLAIFFKYAVIRRFGREMGYVLLVVTAGWFFIFSPSSGLFAFGQGKSGLVTSVENPVPITIIVFDELHTAGILDRDGNIDGVRFPNFGRLAREGVWFPNAVSQSSGTIWALPSLVTGSLVKTLNAPPPTYRSFPNTLFSVLAPIYDIQAFESYVSLCPPTVCEVERSLRLEEVLRDLVVISRRSIYPTPLLAKVPTLTGKWANFAEVETDKEVSWGRFNQGEYSKVYKILENLSERPEIQFNFIHVLEPHAPHDRLFDGRKHSSGWIAGLDANDEFVGKDTLVEIAYHAYLHQIGYVDQMLGKVINSLEAANIWDKSLVIVLADHGVASVNNRRKPDSTGENHQEIYKIPFFVKRPQESMPGLTSQSIVTLTDIVPTVADVLGFDLPWSVEGISVFSTDAASRKSISVDIRERKLKPFSDDEVYGFKRLAWQIDRFGDRSSLEQMMRQDGLHGRLNGKSVSSFRVSGRAGQTRGSIQRGPVGPFSLPSKAETFLPARVQGQITSSSLNDPMTVAISLNGVIRAVTETSTWQGTTGYFEAMLPPAAFQEIGNRLDLYIVQTDADVMLIPVHLEQDAPPSALHHHRTDGEVQQVVENNHGRWKLDLGHGHLDRAAIDGELTSLSGWIANDQFLAPDSVIAFLGDRSILSQHTSIHRNDVVEKLVRLGAKACEDCRHGFSLMLSTEQLVNDLNDLRIIALYADGSATEISGGLEKLESVRSEELLKRVSIEVSVNSKPESSSNIMNVFFGEKSYRVVSTIGHVDRNELSPASVSLVGWSASGEQSLPPESVFLLEGYSKVVARARLSKRVDVERHLGFEGELACTGCRHGWSIRDSVDLSQTPNNLSVIAFFGDGTAMIFPIRGVLQ